MQNQRNNKISPSGIAQLNEISEDGYWSKEYGISMEDLKKDHEHSVYDKIIDAYIKTKNSVETGHFANEVL